MESEEQRMMCIKSKLQNTSLPAGRQAPIIKKVATFNDQIIL